MTQLFIHPEYSERQALWKQAKDLYDGLPDVLKSKDYTWPHQIEISKEDPNNAKLLRFIREQRTQYLNLHRIMVAVWQNMFFRKAAKADKKLKDFLDTHGGWDNIDGLGTSLPMFLKNEILPSILLYGDCYVLADTGDNVGQNLTAQRQEGFRPYLETLHPLSVVDWDIETSDPARFGKYNFLRYEYELIEPRSSCDEMIKMFKMSDSLEVRDGRYIVRRFKLGNEKDVSGTSKLPDIATNTQFVELDTIETALQEIPIAAVTGDAWLDGLAQESLRYHNIRSCYDSVNYNQLYQKIFLIGVQQEDIPKALSEYIYGILPEGAAVQSVEPVDCSGYERAMADALNNAFKTGLLLTRQLPADSRAVQGSETIQEEKDTTIATIEATIEDIETLINEALKNYSQFLGIEDPGTLELNKEIADEDFNSLIAIYTAFKDKLDKVDGATKGVLQKVIMRLGLDEEAQDAALKALEETDLTPEPPMMPSIFSRQSMATEEEDEGEEENE